MMQPGRKYSPGSGYRYGFNGKENDNDVKGDGNQQDYGMRIYDSRLGKFLSVDPLTKEYPWNSTYAFAENDVIRSIDLDGLEKLLVLEYYDKDKFLHHTILSGMRDKETKQAVNMNMKSAQNVKLTTEDLYVIRHDSKGKIFFEGPGGKLNNSQKKIISNAPTDQGTEDQNMPENTMQQTEVTTRGRFVKSAYISNVENEFFETSSMLNPGLKDKIKDLNPNLKAAPSYWGTGNNTNPVNQINGTLAFGTGATNDFVNLVNKIKADGSIKIINMVIPAIINTQLSNGEQNDIHLSIEKLGNAMKDYMLKAGLKNVNFSVQDYKYNSNNQSGAASNRPNPPVNISLAR